MRPLDTKRIVVASHNRGKLEEIAALIGPYGFEARSAADYGLPEPAETGTSFEENAYIKAFAAASATGLPALSDDSGLEIDALDGQPGVYTADWAEKPDGSGRDFMMAMEKTEGLLREKGATTAAQRTGRFVSTLCLAWPDGHAEYFRGEVEGTLVWPPRGGKGHGYDPVFQPLGHTLTFGEMEADEKNGISEPLSHRARSFARFAAAMLALA
jgi:XTP/dITP diphosphohydrolase